MFQILVKYLQIPEINNFFLIEINIILVDLCKIQSAKVEILCNMIKCNCLTVIVTIILVRDIFML